MYTYVDNKIFSHYDKPTINKSKINFDELSNH